MTLPYGSRISSTRSDFSHFLFRSITTTDSVCLLRLLILFRSIFFLFTVFFCFILCSWFCLIWLVAMFSNAECFYWIFRTNRYVAASYKCIYSPDTCIVAMNVCAFSTEILIIEFYFVEIQLVIKLPNRKCSVHTTVKYSCTQ